VLNFTRGDLNVTSAAVTGVKVGRCRLKHGDQGGCQVSPYTRGSVCLCRLKRVGACTVLKRVATCWNVLERDDTTSVKSAWFLRLKLSYDEPLSEYAFNFNFRRYIKECAANASAYDIYELRVIIDSTTSGAVTLAGVSIGDVQLSLIGAGPAGGGLLGVSWDVEGAGSVEAGGGYRYREQALDRRCVPTNRVRASSVSMRIQPATFNLKQFNMKIVTHRSRFECLF